MPSFYPEAEVDNGARCEYSENFTKFLYKLYQLFRHGERTADWINTFNNDLHKDDNFYPIGRGELTNVSPLHNLKIRITTGFLLGWKDTVVLPREVHQKTIQSVFRTLRFAKFDGSKEHRRP